MAMAMAMCGFMRGCGLQKKIAYRKSDFANRGVVD
jgi:hypothetical protein